MKQLLLVALLLQTPATEAFKVGGRILSLDTGALPASVMLRSMNQRQGAGRTAPVNADGTFEFSAAASGEYDLNAVDYARHYRRPSEESAETDCGARCGNPDCIGTPLTRQARTKAWHLAFSVACRDVRDRKARLRHGIREELSFATR